MNINVIISILFNIYLINAKVVVPTIKLNSGRDIPVLGLGTYNATINSPQVVQAIKDAFTAGFRHIDTAQLYNTEKEIGKALTESIAEGVVKREEVFITTKVAPTKLDRNSTLGVVKQALVNLNTTYLDLVLIHWPEGNVTDIYNGLEDAVEQKLVLSIGVSNFDVKALEPLIKSVKVKPALNQIEIHPNLPQFETVEYCQKNGIAVTGFSPLGTGSLLKDSTILSIGTTHNKTTAQVLIKWQLQRGLITVPKTYTKERQIEDLNVFDFTLTDNEVKTLNNLK